MPLENTLKLVRVRVSTTVMRQAFTDGNSEHVFALQAKQVATTLRLCQEYVTDYVAMPSLQPKKSVSTPSAKSSMVPLAASTHSSGTYVEWPSRSQNMNPKNCVGSTVVREDRCRDNKAKV